MSWKGDFVECLETSTLAYRRLDEALNIVRSNQPQRIYRYRRNTEYSRAELTNNTVWLSSPNAYNDPYDCAFKLIDDPLIKAVSVNLVDALITTYKLDQFVSAEDAAAIKKADDPLKDLTTPISCMT
jgi:hypothetical protein